jgi:arylsulfatase A-like enzyme
MLRALQFGKRFVFVSLFGFILGIHHTTPLVAQSAEPKRPNIIFIITDDQNADTFTYMPTLQAELVAKGVTFSNAYTVSPLCCPARVSILRGQYVHNHRVMRNSGTRGGFKRFKNRGLEQSTVATWLSDAGYRTALIGKYLNQYPSASDLSYIPPGWDEWYAWWPAKFRGVERDRYTEFNLNENGRNTRYGREQAVYLTDMLSQRAVDFVTRATADAAPFFLYLAPIAPHGPYTPAPRHAGLFSDLALPKPPSFNESDMSDKPGHMRALPPITEAQTLELTNIYRNQLRTLQAVDEMLASLLTALEAAGELQNTYIIFTTDNGYRYGTHRLMPGKGSAYTEDVRIPLIVRGPGIPQGIVRDHLVANIDLAPTFAEIAAAHVPNFVDGRSLMPLLTAAASPSTPWRNHLLINIGANPNQTGAEYDVLSRRFNMLRSREIAYVRYPDLKSIEYYDLTADPYQLNNLAPTLKQPENAALRERLSKQLRRLLKCSGATCRAIENEPLN